MEMEKEFQDIINKNLPAQVGEALRKRLEQAEVDARGIKTIHERLTVLTSEKAELDNQVKMYKAFDARNAALDSREAMMNEKERNLAIDALTFQLANEKEKTEFTKSVALGLVRNIEYRKQVYDSERQDNYQDSNGNWHYPAPIAKSLEETKKAE